MTGMRPRRWSTATRLTAFLGAMLAVVIGLALLALLRAFTSQTDATTSRANVVELQAFSGAAASRSPHTSFRDFTASYLRSRTLPDGETLVVSLPDHSLIGSAGTEPLLQSPTIRRWAAQPPAHAIRANIEADNHHYLVAAAPVTNGTARVGTVIAAADLAKAHRDLGRVRTLAIGLAATALFAGCLGAYLLLRRLLRRITRITATAADIGSGSLDRRLGEREEKDEVGQLAATFDAMADRVSAAMLTQRRLLSDVSHQLRTPLTVARGHLEVLDRTGRNDPEEVRDTVALVLDEIDHMKALVERLLMLGHAMEPDFLDREPVDLRSFCVDLVETCTVLADRDWLLDGVPDVVLDVDASKLRGALLNLIDNAVRATTTGDVIAVSAVEYGVALVAVSVEDGGPGIPADRRDQVLERFARPGAADADGSGLGLAIARAVAEAHGGSLVLDESAYGGLAARLVLPRADAATTPIVADEAAEPTCVS